MPTSQVVAGDIVTAKYRLRDTPAPAPVVPPTFRSYASTGGSAGTPDPTITLPADVAVGDVLILAWASYYAPGGNPAGWAPALVTTATGGVNPAGVGCWYKTATATDAGSVVHIPVGVSSDYWTASVVAYKNTSGVRVVTTSASAAGLASYATPSATAQASDTAVSVWCHEGGSSGGLSAFTLDLAVTERVRRDWGGGINQFSHVGIGDETLAAAGATTPRVASWAGGASSWGALTFVLKA